MIYKTSDESRRAVWPPGHMIPPEEWHDWKWQWANSLHSRQLQTGRAAFSSLQTGKFWDIAKIYPFRVTPYYLSLMDISDQRDPLRRQCFPDIHEIADHAGGLDDPLQECRDMPVPGLIHRYQDRCLILSTHTCAVYCRHCNRKRWWEKRRPAGMRDYLEPMIAYIHRQKAIREVIVSGGDPLTMSDQNLRQILASLRAIPHVQVLRIGSRMPVVMPMRVTPSLCRLLRQHRPLWFNTQFNHPREITADAARACEMLLDAGIPVSNQSVLLRGVNDSYDTMRELLYGLQRISVRPYYLFQCDPVRGADHFRVDMRTGIEIMEKLWKNISGLCVPRYVVDLPGGLGKQSLEPCSAIAAEHADAPVIQH
jgi:lysine 2,3-aminomutase